MLETLRHIVRQDPDIIVMGEIRDTFSAETAIQASLTGHKVLTTFHTEDAVGGLLRLLNMGIEAFLIASTINCMLAQRLLRRVCPSCTVPYKPTPDEYRRLGYTHGDLPERTCRLAGAVRPVVLPATMAGSASLSCWFSTMKSKKPFWPVKQFRKFAGSASRPPV